MEVLINYCKISKPNRRKEVFDKNDNLKERKTNAISLSISMEKSSKFY